MNDRKTNAFTLIELLVVIAIIALLAAVAFPVFTKMIDSSKSAKCIGNLKSIGAAALSYAAENNGRLPQIDGTGSWSSGTRWWWSVLYNLGTTNVNNIDVKKVWRCPCITDSEFTVGSSTNLVFPCYTPQKPIMGFTYAGVQSMAVAQIQKPSKVWMFGEGGVPTSLSSGGSASTKYMTQGAVQRNPNSWENNIQPAFRHVNNTRANFIACDGHVESLSVQDGTETGAFGYKVGSRRVY